MPNNDTATKKVKDFTAEERVLIAARADKIELSRVAKEFNTTWQVVSAIQRDERKKAVQAKQAKKSKKASKQEAAPAKKAKAKRTEENSAKKKLSNEEKNAILARANEIGATNAANEAGISKWTIFQWRKMLKKSGVAVEPLSRKKTITAPSSAKNTKAKKSAPKTEEAPSSEKIQKVSRPSKFKAGNVPNSLEFENALLKEQVASLTKQVEKLKAAIAQLA